MLKTLKFRLYPSRRQARLLSSWLEECRWLYNHFLEERKAAWEPAQHSVDYHAQAVSLPSLKQSRASLAEVHSQVLQNVAVRVDLAFQAFFRRVKNGKEPGYPRFKGYGRYDSMTFPQYPTGCSLKGDSLRITRIGQVKIEVHRPIQGKPKTVTLRRMSTGKWFACFACQEVDSKTLPISHEKTGIDVGLHSFATLSDGAAVANPQFFRRDERDLARTQRRLSKCEKGTIERKKVVSRIHERIANRRADFCHQLSRRIVNQFGLICVEDLQVNRMVHNHCLAKSIADAAWSAFFSHLRVKAAEAGREFVAVNPAYTSQTCSSCGHRQAMPLSERVFSCSCCSVQLDRDHNAALNILGLGLQSLGYALEAPAFRRGE